MTRARFGLALLSLALNAGCTVTARSADVDEGPVNSCGPDNDCGDGATCSAGVCQTLNGQLEALLFEVTPTSDSKLPHIPFVTHLEDVPTSGGSIDLQLTRSVHLHGKLEPYDVAGCLRTFLGPENNMLSPSTDGSSMPVSVTFTPRETLLGLPSQVYIADATSPKINDLRQVEYTFDLQVPAGNYDVYLEPGPQEVAAMDPNASAAERKRIETCRVPPQLFRSVALFDAEIDLFYKPHPTTTLAVTITFPETGGLLDDWVVDLIEPVGGRPISSSRVLGTPKLVSEPNAMTPLYEYQALLAYSGVDEAGKDAPMIDGATDLVRLRPPPTVVAPTIFMDRSGLGLFGTDSVSIQGFTQVPPTVTVQGQMAGALDGAPTSGRVNLVSTEIFGIDPGVFAAYRRTVEVDETGLFTVELPPGKYRVYATPPLLDDPSRSLSALETTWDVPADAPFQAGKVLELPRLTEVTGQTSLRGADVRVAASPQSVLPFEQAFGAAAFVPRAVAGLVDQAGRFVVAADPGTFDVAIRPSESSLYAWSVRPGFTVQPGNPRQELPRLGARTPSVVTGTAQLGDDKLTAALIRAYAYLDKDLAYTGDPAEARSVVQVAETRTDADGAFRLFVPDSIAPPK